MSLTRANVEFIMVADTSPLLTQAGMAVTVAGANADLNNPIGKAVNDMGYTVSSPVLVTDVDVAQVTDTQQYEFLAVAQLHTLEAIASHLDDTDITVGPRTEKLSQLVAQVERKIKRLREELEDLYGFGLSTLSFGVLTQNFGEHDA